MRNVLIAFCFLFSSLAALQEDLKEHICQLENKQRTDQETLDLVKLYYRDQQHQKAFDLYLSLLNQEKRSISNYKITENEAVLYQDALKIYLDSNLNVSQAARCILSNYALLMKENPQYYSLGFLVAASYANLSMFDQFFEQFYRSYENDPAHYLAHKTIASLYLRLFEREPPGNNKERYREKILCQLDQALEENPEDVNLHKLIWLYSHEDQKKNKIYQSLNKIINRHIVIPRGEIRYFVTQALNYNQIEICQIFLEEMKKYHQYSRAIIQAQQLIDEKITKISKE